MLISKTPVASSGDVNANLASQLSNFPAIVVDAFTWNLVQLSVGVISKIGACARLSETNTVEATKHKIANSMPRSERRFLFFVNLGCNNEHLPL